MTVLYIKKEGSNFIILFLYLIVFLFAFLSFILFFSNWHMVKWNILVYRSMNFNTCID